MTYADAKKYIYLSFTLNLTDVQCGETGIKLIYYTLGLAKVLAPAFCTSWRNVRAAHEPADSEALQ